VGAHVAGAGAPQRHHRRVVIADVVLADAAGGAGERPAPAALTRELTESCRRASRRTRCPP